MRSFLSVIRDLFSGARAGVRLLFRKEQYPQQKQTRGEQDRIRIKSFCRTTGTISKKPQTGRNGLQYIYIKWTGQHPENMKKYLLQMSEQMTDVHYYSRSQTFWSQDPSHTQKLRTPESICVCGFYLLVLTLLEIKMDFKSIY